jgi:leucyl aminopeptidase
MIIMSYKGDESSDKYMSIIGKGVIFDSGGLNIKSL